MKPVLFGFGYVGSIKIFLASLSLVFAPKIIALERRHFLIFPRIYSLALSPLDNSFGRVPLDNSFAQL
jgi:hypothetical protein